jgi:hypothetical protein
MAGKKPGKHLTCLRYVTSESTDLNDCLRFTSQLFDGIDISQLSVPNGGKFLEQRRSPTCLSGFAISPKRHSDSFHRQLLAVSDNGEGELVFTVHIRSRVIGESVDPGTF